MCVSMRSSGEYHRECTLLKCSLYALYGAYMYVCKYAEQRGVSTGVLVVQVLVVCVVECLHVCMCVRG